MIVCIAEKQSQAQNIAQVLGATEPKQGYYEGNGYQVTWAMGHFCELKYPEDYSPAWKHWSLGQLPMVPERFGIRLIDSASKQRQFGVIKQLIDRADSIINCGDAGQEGELIQRWIMQKAGAKCPVQRLWVSSLTEEAIAEGFKHLLPQEEKQSLYEAGLCRAIGDWLLGMNATRLYTLKYGGYRRQGQQPLSIGRVQTPTLALIVNRQQEIENFKPEDYWVLATTYRDTLFTAVLDDEEEEETAAPGDKKGALRRGFKTEEEGRAALAKIEGTPFTVTSVAKKNGTEAPPRLFDLTGLQVECNKKFGYSAEQTLQIIQGLYERKLTTYPRVDTTYLTDDIYPKCKGILNGIAPVYGNLLTPLRGAPLRKSKKVFDNSKVTDHHAIIPTGVPANALTDVERNVYDLICRRFIQNFYPDCKFSTTTVTGEAAGVNFRASGKQILEAGWRDVPASGAASVPANEPDDEATAKNSAADNAEERTLPAFAKGESGPHKPGLTKKTTQPPKPYTEATLLRAMETAGKMVDDESLREALKQNGIGRPSTRAAIIETLFKRQYIRKQRKSLIATPTGVELIGLIKEDLLKSVELTGIWEHRLRLIEQREYSPAQFIGELKQMVSDVVVQVLSDNSNRRVTFEAPAATPPQAAASQDEQPKQRKRVIRAGSICPQCGIGKVIKGKTAYGCSRWKEGCDWRKPFKQ